MADFVNLDISADREAMATRVYEAIALAFPGWEPAEGNLETFLVDNLAALYAEVVDLVSVVGEEVFGEFGRTVAQLPPIAAASATVTSTWTMIDDSGYTISPGTLVGVQAAGDNIVAFEVVTEVVVAPGDTATAAGAVTLRAVQEGDEGNELTGSASMIDALDFVASVALVGSTSGGADAEDPAAYLDRLRGELQLMSPRPILPAHFQQLALRNAAVARAIAIDGWDPADDSLDNERFVGLALVDEDGEGVATGVKDEVEAYLDAMREVNFVVAVGGPDYTDIDVAATVRCFTGFDPATVDATVTAAVTSYLQPYNWGRLTFGNQPTADPTWVNQKVVRYFDLVRLIEMQRGVDYIESLTVEGGTVDVNLTGVVTLTRPGTVAVTANAA